MRFRAIACAVTRALLGRAGVLAEMPVQRSVRALGFADARNYSQILERHLDYTNTFPDEDPALDADDPTSIARYGLQELIICSEIIEHTRRPPAQVLPDLAGALKPGGHLVLSAPTYLMPESIERYPSLQGFSVEAVAGGSLQVRYRTRFGSTGVDVAPVFHGTDGRGLEIRMISHAQLLRELRSAGLEVLPAIDSALRIHGAAWPSVVERQDLPVPTDGSVILARRPA